MKMMNKERTTMRVCKKVMIGTAAAIASAFAVNAGAKAVDKLRRKWFANGFEAGRLVERVTTAADTAHKQAVIKQKYDKLCKEYDELQSEYNEMLDYYNED
ncbi:hypothetical protein [Ruminococcus flavefaciens]|uniref:hypothetical protein n=1 Tax=Ruminococcus flavefaciens TaxID=1265 RepID=UPI0026F0F71D|nr:hypothetical protein [Ruminococcus flavefaciens]